EQGLGDVLQFIRYAPLVKQRCATTVVQCPPSLVRLLARCPGVDRLVAIGSALPDFDAYVPLLSLPGLLDTTLETIPSRVPYLEPDPELVQQWRARLQSVTGFRVGIAWQGNPKHKNDRWRSAPLSQFAHLAEVPGVTLVSLQKGPGSE